MGWKCTPQITGLVRGQPKITTTKNKKLPSKQKHRSNAKGICGEAGKERCSASSTLDRTRTKNNQYEGYESGFEAHDEMIRLADECVTTYVDKNGVQRSRKLKSDAVIGYAMIFNPPEEVCCTWTKEQYDKFYLDSWEIMKELHPNMFRDDNILMRTEHRDEGIGKNDYHQHIIGVPRDADGHYCGNGIDAKMLAELNRDYPRMMRERGWYEMDDLDTTTWRRCKTDKAYKDKRKDKAKQSGKSVNKYIADKATETYNQAQELLAKAQKLHEQLQAEQRPNLNSMEVSDWMLEEFDGEPVYDDEEQVEVKEVPVPVQDHTEPKSMEELLMDELGREDLDFLAALGTAPASVKANLSKPIEPSKEIKAEKPKLATRVNKEPQQVQQARPARVKANLSKPIEPSKEIKAEKPKLATRVNKEPQQVQQARPARKVFKRRVLEAPEDNVNLGQDNDYGF